MALNLGAISLTALYLGSTAISTAYLGSVQVYSTGGAFTPASLFASGEEGAWYEPSTTTCFTDTAGTIAATYGDAVARINDLSGNGNHATQATSTARPILARVPETGRRNLLESSTDLSTWVVSNGCSLAQNGSEDPLGDVSWRFTSGTTVATFNQAHLLNAVSISAGTFTWSIYAKQGTARYIAFGHASSLLVSNVAVSVIFDLQTGQFSDTLNGPNPIYIDSYSAEDAGNGWWRIEFQSDLNNANYDNIVFGISPDGTYANLSHVGTGIYADFSAPQIEFASSATAYQKVVDQYDITEAGVTSLEYLAFDGSDDFMTISTSAFPCSSAAFAGGVTTSTGYKGVLTNTTDQGTNGDFAFLTENLAFFIAQGNGNGLFGFVDKNGASGSSFTSGEVAVFYGDATGFPGTAQLENGAQIGKDRATGAHANLDLYGMLVIDRILLSQERSDTESYLAAKSGVTL